MASAIHVKKEKIVARFGGMGFHNSEAGMYRQMCDRQFNEVVCKIYRELSPGFSRISGGSPNWTKEQMDDFAEYCGKMQCVTDTDIYLTGHCVRYSTDEELAEYARNVADRLEYVIREKGIKNVQIYCMSNELSLDDWGDLNFEMETFRRYHTALYNEFRRRNLNVKLLATDASPMERWETIEWALQHGMAPISGVFGGHHYSNDFMPEDLEFYKIFKRHCQDVIDMLKPYERRFILGEFGLAQAFKQNHNNYNCVKMDVCDAFYNGKEAFSALQVCEMAMAAMNAGVYAMALWTFTDIPNPTGLSFRMNKWGLTRWDDDDYSARDWLYAYGLLVKFFRKNSKPLNITAEDFLLRCAGTTNDDGSCSVAIINRHPESVEVELSFEDMACAKALRRYEYDSNNVPRNDFSDLQDYVELVEVRNGKATVRVPGYSVNMLTTDYTDHIPEAVEVISAENGLVKWNACTEKQHRYYRVYKGATEDFVPSRENQAASTVAEYWQDDSGEEGFYKVLSVDDSGNSRL